MHGTRFGLKVPLGRYRGDPTKKVNFNFQRHLPGVLFSKLSLAIESLLKIPWCFQGQADSKSFKKRSQTCLSDRSFEACFSAKQFKSNSNTADKAAQQGLPH
jgi:hypothetical protein